MEKEMIISCSSHERKVAILEDNQLVEVWYERERESNSAGGIYKGRVTRVLPGMQSAFVDIGLERDAFLYVSDFFEDNEEYEKIVSVIEDKVAREELRSLPATLQPIPSVAVQEVPVSPAVSETIPPMPTPRPQEERPRRQEHPSNRHGGRPRRGRSRRRGFPDSKYAKRSPEQPVVEEQPVTSAPIILPGESLAKYRDKDTQSSDRAIADENQQFISSETESYQDSLDVKVDSVMGTESSANSNLTVSPEISEHELRSDDSPDQLSAVSLNETLDTFDDDENQDIPSEAAFVSSSRELIEDAAPSSQWSDENELLDLPSKFVGDEDQIVSGDVALPTDEPVQEFAGAESEPVEFQEMEQLAELGDGLQPPTDLQQSVPTETAMPQEASVREKARNPRFNRKSQWQARREARAQKTGSVAKPKEPSIPRPLIADLLKEGQEIIVQVAKEPLGKKGARITSHIALPGRFLVYMPTVNHIGISHKIATDQERQRLKRMLKELTEGLPGGFIVRTAGEGCSEADFRQDVFFLSKLWGEIRGQAEKKKAPSRLHNDLDLIERTLRDQLSDEYTTVWVDNEQEYEKIVEWISRFQPSLVGRVKLYTKDAPLYEAMGIQEEINKALKPKVWLKSGGYIVINQTEALVAIDVNTGKFVGKSNRLEDTIVKTNIDAIQEIVRQIRLRDLGGIIVIDFIDMDERRNRQKVLSALEDTLRSDRAPSKTLGFNEFGLVAITRKRVRQSLERTLGDSCPYCSGSGLVKSVNTVCCEILSEARKMAGQIEGKQITLRVNPEVGKALKARDNTILPDIEDLTGKNVLVRNDPSLHVEVYNFE
ncbi:MAG: hypothetical protein A3F68_07210 [Acidobacteria bacterium RIFCSPLOWO2_12_FULL_54_10]|nr:MAG: hypothetical protein A3F68_07210 [Acidobacteria bacterium RIFCSPLOWO2_12_FULL_54_10]